jgi:hypothetical protein
MIDLEKHIRDTAGQLDLDLPREGHEARFIKRLGKPVRRVHFRHVIQVAASIAIILASSVILIRRDQNGSKIAAGEIPAAVLETENYYATRVNEKYGEIKAFAFNDEEEKNVLLEELKDLDVLHHQLLYDLEANPGDERVINALIRHYQIKLEVMDQIIYQLNQLKTETEKQNEHENI